MWQSGREVCYFKNEMFKRKYSKTTCVKSISRGFQFLCGYNIKNKYIKKPYMANANKVVNIS